MEMYTKEMLKAMQDVDIRTVNCDDLVDIRDVKIDPTLSKEEKFLQFMRQIKNPYCYRYGKYVVKVSFSNTEVSLEERLIHYVRSKHQ